MAKDMVEVMEHFGHRRFRVASHDRVDGRFELCRRRLRILQ